MTTNQILALAEIAKWNSDVAGMVAENAFMVEVGRGVYHTETAFVLVSEAAMARISELLKGEGKHGPTDGR